MTTQFTHQQEVESSRSSARLVPPHSIEHEVHTRLTQHPGLVVRSLVVRRIPNGVCLEGRVEVADEAFDLARLIRDIPGMDEFVNHLVINSVSASEDSAAEM